MGSIGEGPRLNVDNLERMRALNLGAEHGYYCREQLNRKPE